MSATPDKRGRDGARPSMEGDAPAAPVRGLVNQAPAEGAGFAIGRTGRDGARPSMEGAGPGPESPPYATRYESEP